MVPSLPKAWLRFEEWKPPVADEFRHEEDDEQRHRWGRVTHIQRARGISEQQEQCHLPEFDELSNVLCLHCHCAGVTSSLGTFEHLRCDRAAEEMNFYFILFSI